MDNPNQTRLVVSATFTADPIVAPLKFWFEQLELNLDLVLAPFNQIFQQLLASDSLINQNQTGCNLLLVRIDDLYQAGDSAQKVDSAIDQLSQSLASSAQRVPQATTIVVVCPSAQQDNAAHEARLTEKLSSLERLTLLRPDDIRRWYPVDDVHDAEAARLAEIPYHRQYFVAIASAVSRRYYQQHFPAAKVLVLDCDDTLWGGICGEVGPTGVTVDQGHRDLQAFAKQQQQAGRLICLASRNNQQDVTAVFEQHPDMLLSLDDIAASKINWNRKSDNLVELADELGLGLDSFVFIDDDAMQCNEVLERLPEVLVQQVSFSNPTTMLTQHIWPLDIGAVTREAQARTQSYREHASREQVRQQSLSLQAFLDSLELKVSVAALTNADVPRATELCQRTNQFNLTAWRLTESEVTRLLVDPVANCLTVTVSDRFGDYGLVGLLVLAPGPTGWLELPLFLLSCRALGRGVEHEMLRHAGRLAASKGYEGLHVQCKQTERNQPARDFVRSIDPGIAFSASINKATISAEAAAKFAPDLERRAVQPATTAAEKRSVANRPAVIQRIAYDLATIAQIESRLGYSDETNDELASAEAFLRAAFCRSLGLDDVGLDDGFFDLGGHSLQAVQVLADTSNHFAIELDPTLLFTTNFTVNELSEEIEHLRNSAGQEIGSVLDQLSALTD